MTRPDTGRVVVGMSGGVDSSVAALLLCEQGYEVHGLFMRNWEEEDDDYCNAAEDFQEARQVCEHLGIPLHKISFAREYRDRVFAHFLSEYRNGRTPNPDVLCNREIKFGVFLDYARRLGARRIATGHYARIRLGHGRAELLKGLDENKDQSYFLHAVPHAALERTLFPLGDLTKDRVREIAQAGGLPNFARKDSTGICFIGERPFREFLSRYLPAQPGEMCTIDGEVVGRHHGLMYYTLGQRQGLGIGGRRGSGGAPWYVVAKDLDRNVLVVALGRDHGLLHSIGLHAGQLSWVAGEPPPLPLRCTARVRYRQCEQACVVEALGEDRIAMRFDEPQWAVTPGQYVVLYEGAVCLGGGVIESTASLDDETPTGGAGPASAAGSRC